MFSYHNISQLKFACIRLISTILCVYLVFTLMQLGIPYYLCVAVGIPMQIELLSSSQKWEAQEDAEYMEKEIQKKNV